MKTLQEISSLEVKIEDFVGLMGTNSIRHISARDLGLEEDVQGYISVQDSDGFYYAEVLDGDGNGSYAKAKNIDEVEKWLTDTVYRYAS
ncbi:MAG TPA: hypothetical protein VL947_06115 [Cytophagales bacterium]|nr:hypothetical protein [Cytophagales bacterium]